MRKDIIYILLLLLITDLSIILDIPILRQSLPFIFFTLIPGLLILKSLKLEMDLSRFSVLSVALSVSFLYLTGLLVNTLFPVRPLSYPFLVISNLLIVLLTLILREEKLFDFQITFKRAESKIYLAGLILPLIVIIGSYLLNKCNNNFLIIISLIYLLIYVVMIFRVKDVNLSYAFIIWILSISLVFMVSLRTDYLISGDTPVEYNLFKASASEFKWSLTPPPYSLRPSYNTCLSITILPSLYYYMTGLNGFYIFKIFLISIVSLVPVAIYELNTLFLSRQDSFLNTLLFISYYQFIYSISNMRTFIATLYFVLIILLIFDESLPRIKRSLLSLIFVVSLVFSHYSTTYAAFIFLAVAFIIISALNVYQKNQTRMTRFTLTFILFLFVLLFLWYALINSHTSIFDQFVSFLKNTLTSLNDAFKDDMYSASGQRILGVGLKWPAEYINLLVYYIVMFTIFIGFLSELINRVKRMGSKFNDDYLILMTVSMAILASVILMPYVSKGYGPERLLIFCLVTLSTCFVLGVDKINTIINKIFNNNNIDLNIISVVIIILFLFTNIGVIYQIFGDHHSLIFNNDGYQYETTTLHKEELYGALWLNATKNNLKFVWGDRYTSERLVCFGLHLYPEGGDQPSNNTYIFLRKGIICTGKFYTGDFDFKNLDRDYDLSTYNELYDNGGTRILAGSKLG